jgi:hypothetical protein
MFGFRLCRFLFVCLFGGLIGWLVGGLAGWWLVGWYWLFSLLFCFGLVWFSYIFSVPFFWNSFIPMLGLMNLFL